MECLLALQWVAHLLARLCQVRCHLCTRRPCRHTPPVLQADHHGQGLVLAWTPGVFLVFGTMVGQGCNHRHRH